MAGAGDAIVPWNEPLFRGEVLPVDGRIRLTDAPGFGLELDESVPLLRPITPDWADKL
jgi:L-rhamnonate dehydratase